MTKIKFSKHALFVLRERNIKKSAIIKILRESIFITHKTETRKITQGIIKIKGKNYLLRVIYDLINNTIEIVTAYITSKIKKYLKL